MNRNEIIQVLTEIKKECEKHMNCNGCPIYSNESDLGCVIDANDPCEWTVDKESEE